MRYNLLAGSVIGSVIESFGDSYRIYRACELSYFFRRCFFSTSKSSKLDAPMLRHQLWSGWSIIITVHRCHALRCIPVKHNWKFMNKVLKRDEKGWAPKFPPSIGIPSKVRHSAAGPRMADKEQCKCSAVYKLLHCCGRVATIQSTSCSTAVAE